MTRMIPETIHSSVESAAERRMFEVIRDAPNTERWVCRHSLRLAHHETKRRAEIDFVLITHHGIFVLEVKGGRIKRQRGVWYAVDKDNVAHKLAESPFDQASNNMFALQRQIKKQFRGQPHANALFGYAVLMPDIVFELDDPEADRHLLYDIRDTERPFTSFINRLAEASRKAEAREKRPALQAQWIADLGDYLWGDFDFKPAADLIIGSLRKQLDKITREQRVVLDMLEDSQRVIVEGGAGTGKTLLAVDAAKRLASEGRRVLFLCYNKLLAARIEQRLAADSYEGELLVRHLDRYFKEHLVDGTEWEQLVNEAIQRDKQTGFGEVLPEYAALAAIEREDERFDAIVIDETQDILNQKNLDILDQMLRGGLEQGRWCFFLDGQEQKEVFGKMEQHALEHLRAHAVRTRLSLNCRNTRQIAEQAAIVSSSTSRVSTRIDGAAVEFCCYRKRDGWFADLAQVLQKLEEEGVARGRVSVLTVKSPSSEEEARLHKMGLRPLCEQDVPKLGTSLLEHVTWSTISGFKGLENDVAVVVGIEDIDRDWHRSVAYVGMSRARSRLYVVIREDCNAQRKEREKEWKARQDSDVEMLL